MNVVCERGHDCSTRANSGRSHTSLGLTTVLIFHNGPLSLDGVVQERRDRPLNGRTVVAHRGRQFEYRVFSPCVETCSRRFSCVLMKIGSCKSSE